MQSQIINISKLDHYSKKRLKTKRILHGCSTCTTDGKQRLPRGIAGTTEAANGRGDRYSKLIRYEALHAFKTTLCPGHKLLQLCSATT